MLTNQLRAAVAGHQQTGIIPGAIHAWNSGNWVLGPGPSPTSIFDKVSPSTPLTHVGAPFVTNINGHPAWNNYNPSVYMTCNVPSVSMSKFTVVMVGTPGLGGGFGYDLSFGGVAAGTQNYWACQNGVGMQLYLNAALVLNSFLSTEFNAGVVMMSTADLTPSSGSRKIRWHIRDSLGIHTTSTNTSTATATNFSRIAIGAAEGIAISQGSVVVSVQVSPNFTEDADAPDLMEKLYRKWIA